MTIKSRTITLLISSILIIGSLIYYFGFVYSFRNYGEGGNWKPLNEYQFTIDKETAEKRIYQLVSANRASLWFADTSYKFSKDGWIAIFVASYVDTTEYIFRFKGNDSS